MTWRETRDGYGLQEVPRELARKLGCCMCSSEFPLRGKLYTAEPLPDASSPRAYSRQVDSLHGKCYCTMHAKAMYKG